MGGADVIDIKEPRRGALGAADSSVWQAVRRVIGPRAVLSVALGELLDDPIIDNASAAAGFSFAKIGFAGCRQRRDWIERWLAVTEALTPGARAVPVAYADWHAAGRPPPSVSLEVARTMPGRLLLVDTHNKSRGGLLDSLSLAAVRQLIADAQRCGVQVALAGSLDAAAIERLLPLAPDYVGVRGAACRGSRDGAIDLARVKSLARLVRGMRHNAAV